jgi:hypothetical protein
MIYFLDQNMLKPYFKGSHQTPYIWHTSRGTMHSGRFAALCTQYTTTNSHQTVLSEAATKSIKISMVKQEISDIKTQTRKGMLHTISNVQFVILKHTVIIIATVPVFVQDHM